MEQEHMFGIHYIGLFLFLQEKWQQPAAIFLRRVFGTLSVKGHTQPRRLTASATRLIATI